MTLGEKISILALSAAVLFLLGMFYYAVYKVIIINQAERSARKVIVRTE